MTSVAEPTPHRQGHPLRWLFFVLLLAPALLLAGCARESGPEVLRLQGGTMGTTWHVTAHPAPAAGADIGERIEAELDAINQSMSTYLADSEISRFNALPPGQSMVVSEPFAEVLEAALEIGALSDGAYDVTVGPLVDLWGFGARDAPEATPDEAAIAQALALTGQQRLGWDAQERRLSKPLALRLDFSSIAKGYAVDRLARLLEQRGVSDYLVEIGGEVRVAGSSPRGDAWRIAIERPDLGARAVAEGLALTAASVATSGDYRNFLMLDGQRYAHIIDPRSGRPVTHELVSVTVVHPQCMVADGLATALTVLGPEQALALAEREGLAVYLISRAGEALETHFSSTFARYLERGQ